MNRLVRQTVVGIVLAIGLARICAGAEPIPAIRQPPNSGERPWESPTNALTLLQRSFGVDGNSLLVQGDIDFLIPEDGGGACATVAGINCLQALRVMAGLDSLPNLHRVALAGFENQPRLLKGRVSNEGFIGLVKWGEARLDGARLAIDIESAPNSPHAKEKFWPKSSGPTLAVHPRQIKVLSFTVTDEATVLGRHFVLLKEFKKNQITVVDPRKPGKDFTYVVEEKTSKGGDVEQVFFLQPAGAPPRSMVFELNTVFTISILDEEAEGEPSRNAVSVDVVKRKFDETAEALRGTGDYMSPRAWRKKTARFGLPGLDLPVEFGGSGWRTSKVLEVFRHAGEHNLNFRDVVGGAHVRPLLKSSDPRVLDIVRQVASGNGYVAIAITEPTAGSDVSAIKSSCRKVDGGYLLTGTKRFNARLDQATHVIIFTQGSGGEKGKLTVFVVPIDADGLKIERLTAHGLTGNSFGGLTFTDLFVPESHRIGADGEGLRIFFEHFLYWRLMQTAAAIGTGQNALQQMAERIKTRNAFGAPIGRFTHLQQPIGQYTTELKMAFALAREAAAMIDEGRYSEARAIICGLKAEGVENALSAVDAAMRAFGGEGYSTMVDIGDRLRDLNGLRIADGTTDVMRMDVVRHTFGDEFWQMAIERRDRE